VVELAIAFTLWLSFGAFLTLPHVGAPPVFAKMAIGLCASELVAAIAWSAGRDACSPGDCSPLVDAAGNAAGLQIPVAFGAVLLVGLAYAVHVARSW
jgi:hypothetical protein